MPERRFGGAMEKKITAGMGRGHLRGGEKKKRRRWGRRGEKGRGNKFEKWRENGRGRKMTVE